VTAGEKPIDECQTRKITGDQAEREQYDLKVISQTKTTRGEGGNNQVEGSTTCHRGDPKRDFVSANAKSSGTKHKLYVPGPPRW